MKDMLNCFLMITIQVLQDEFLELSRVASGTFGSVVKVSQHSLMVGGTVYVRANIFLTCPCFSMTILFMFKIIPF